MVRCSCNNLFSVYSEQGAEEQGEQRGTHQICAQRWTPSGCGERYSSTRRCIETTQRRHTHTPQNCHLKIFVFRIFEVKKALCLSITCYLFCTVGIKFKTFHTWVVLYNHIKSKLRIKTVFLYCIFRLSDKGALIILYAISLNNATGYRCTNLDHLSSIGLHAHTGTAHNPPPPVLEKDFAAGVISEFKDWRLGCSDFDFFHILRYNNPSLTP